MKISLKAKRFAAKLGLSDAESVLQIECGLHSGFPKCCILFFIGVWRHLEGDRVWVDSRTYAISPGWRTKISLPIAQYNILMRSMKAIDPQYIQCPHCLLNRRIVKVKRCKCGV